MFCIVLSILSAIAAQNSDAIKVYRNQYSSIVNEYFSSTNYVDRVAIRAKLEALKNSNLHLFTNSTVSAHE